MPDTPPPASQPRQASPPPDPRTLPPADPPVRPAARSWRDALPGLPMPTLPAVPARVLAGAAAAASVAVATVVAVVALRGAPASPPPLVLPRALSGSNPAARVDATDATDATDDAAGTTSASVGNAAYVHAAGAVARPGVYRVRAGGRVADLLDAAGGPAPDADLDQVNLAAKVADGERVYVPRRGESPPPPAASGAGGTSGTPGPAAGPVNLNTATLEQLDALPGVGPATAQAILDYRKAQGRFRRVDELLEVRGIGEAKLAALRPRVRV